MKNVESLLGIIYDFRHSQELPGIHSCHLWTLKTNIHWLLGNTDSASEGSAGHYNFQPSSQTDGATV